jgi:putative membrane protein
MLYFDKDVRVKLIKLISMVLVVLIGVSFACLNSEVIKVNLYITEIKIYLSILLVLALGLGILLGFLSMVGAYLRLKAENYRITNKAKWAEKEISNLRSLPIKDAQ